MRPVEDEQAVALTLAAMKSAGDADGAVAGENVVVEHLTDARLEDLSFEIGAGEILGVAGLIGSGAEDLPYLLFGARPAAAARCAWGPRPSTSACSARSAACGSASPSCPPTARCRA